jgi:hypothetical protein
VWAGITPFRPHPLPRGAHAWQQGGGVATALHVHVSRLGWGAALGRVPGLRVSMRLPADPSRSRERARIIPPPSPAPSLRQPAHCAAGEVGAHSVDSPVSCPNVSGSAVSLLIRKSLRRGTRARQRQPSVGPRATPPKRTTPVRVRTRCRTRDAVLVRGRRGGGRLDPVRPPAPPSPQCCPVELMRRGGHVQPPPRAYLVKMPLKNGR